MFSRFRTVVKFLTLFSVEWIFFPSVYSGVVLRSVIVGASRKYRCFGRVTSFLLCVGKRDSPLLSSVGEISKYGMGRRSVVPSQKVLTLCKLINMTFICNDCA